MPPAGAAAAAGRAGVPFEQESLKIQIGNFLLMENGQPLIFDRPTVSAYLKQAADSAMPQDLVATNMSNDLSGNRSHLKTQRLDNPVIITVSIGNGHGSGKAWGCDLSYDYVKINAEYTT